MPVKIFVLGRSGSGKSTVVNRILELAQKAKCPARRMKDYHILYKMYCEDTECAMFQSADYGGFNVIDYRAYDVALVRLEKNLREELLPERQEIVTIEFARDSYRHAFRKFSPCFLQDAYFFFVEAGVDKCIERIHKRVLNLTIPDNHFVPDLVVREYFGRDNWPYMAYEFKQEYGIDKEVVAYRNGGSLDDLYEQVDHFAQTIFSREFSQALQARQPVQAL
jgi:gluconate kinase